MLPRIDGLTVCRRLRQQGSRVPVLMLTARDALVGAVAAAFLSGGVLSLGSLVGLVAVVGIAARNGIMLVSYFRHLETQEGMPFGRDLVMRGAEERVAPILMTALATGLALLPIALGGNRAGQEIEHPLAVVILGGLVTSTILNLFLLPPLYLRYGHGKPAAPTPVLTGLVVVLLALGPAAATAKAQVITPPAGPPPTPRHTGVKALFKNLVDDVKHLPSKENLFWVGVGGSLALAVHPIDDNVNEAWVGNAAVENFFKPGRILGSFPVLMGSAVTTYVAGRSRDQPRLSHMGMDLIQAIMVSEAIVQPIKFIAHRERPDKSSFNSFPSGHSADTFAFATALERHLGWRGAVPAYIFSSYVAISRVPANRHWLSDAVFGATVGIIAGRTVTRHGREFPITVSAGPGGVMIGYVHMPRSNSRRTR